MNLARAHAEEAEEGNFEHGPRLQPALIILVSHLFGQAEASPPSLRPNARLPLLALRSSLASYLFAIQRVVRCSTGPSGLIQRR